jgi:plasmid stabilization system protein ParE
LSRTFTLELDRDALGDLADIRDHVSSARGPRFASEFIGHILDHLSGFETAPLRGTRREEIRPGLRLIGWRRTLTIAFTVDEAAARVVILGVLYRGRDVEAVLDRRSR